VHLVCAHWQPDIRIKNVITMGPVDVTPVIGPPPGSLAPSTSITPVASDQQAGYSAIEGLVALLECDPATYRIKAEDDAATAMATPGLALLPADAGAAAPVEVSDDEEWTGDAAPKPAVKQETSDSAAVASASAVLADAAGPCEVSSAATHDVSASTAIGSALDAVISGSASAEAGVDTGSACCVHSGSEGHIHDSAAPLLDAETTAASDSAADVVVAATPPCADCGSAEGVTVACSRPGCFVRYHPLCAWYSGTFVTVTTNTVVDFARSRYHPACGAKYSLYCQKHLPEDVLKDRRSTVEQRTLRCKYRAQEGDTETVSMPAVVFVLCPYPSFLPAWDDV
jgi:hypothetical protein